MSSAREYVQVNVYRSGTGWLATISLREAGRPYARVRRSKTIKLYGPQRQDMRSACEAAAEMLRREFPDS